MADPANPAEGVKGFKAPVRLQYQITAGRALSRYLRGLGKGQLLGQRCPSCKKVYLPPLGACPACGVATDEEVRLPETGTVTTFCVVNVPAEGLARELPYVCANVLVDGADISCLQLIEGIPAREVRMGLRVKAVWAEPLLPRVESLRSFVPTGEPDAPFDAYKDYL